MNSPPIGNGDICPFCRQHLPKEISFPHVRGWLRRAVVHILLHYPGISTQGIIDRVYAGDVYGNVPTTRKTIHVTMVHLRKQLRLDGYEIASSRGRGGGYRLQKFKGESNAVRGMSRVRTHEQDHEEDTTRCKV